MIDPDGGWRPIRSLWGVVVALDLGDPPTHVLEEADIDIEPGTEPGERDQGRSFSLVTAGKASSLGSTFLDEEPDAAALVPSLVARGSTFVPGIAAARIGVHRVCARPLSVGGHSSARYQGSTDCGSRPGTGRGASRPGRQAAG